MKALSEQSLNKQSKIVVQRDVVVRISADRAEKKSIAAVAAAAVSTGAAVNAPATFDRPPMRCVCSPALQPGGSALDPLPIFGKMLLV